MQGDARIDKAVLRREILSSGVSETQRYLYLSIYKMLYGLRLNESCF